MRGVRGVVAAIKWAYFTAAAVNGYHVAPVDKTGRAWRASGALVPGLVDAYKIAQRPLWFVAPLKRGAWRWEIHTLTRHDDGSFTATLGPLSLEDTNGITRTATRH